jgi:hypothetical protein
MVKTRNPFSVCRKQVSGHSAGVEKLDSSAKVVYGAGITHQTRKRTTMTHGARPQPQVPQTPNVFFDGTRLGLEGTMLATLATAIPGGLHIALAVKLGYALRLDDFARVEPKSFSLVSFLFIAVVAVIALSMTMFFLLVIPTMVYSMGLVAFMLRWAGKRRRRERLASTIVGSVLGLAVGLLSSSLVFLLMDLQPTWDLYGTVLHWPEILSVDGITLIWLTLNPLFSAIAGAQIGWRLGKMILDMTMYWFW